MRHLVAGGAGFLGAAVCRQLMADGDEAIAYDQTPGNVLAAVLGPDIAREITVRGDVTDPLHLLRTAKERGVDTIIYLPSLLGPAANRDTPAAVRVNVGGLVNAFETARILGLRKVVWASSWAVFRGYRAGDRVANDAPFRPINIYGGTKILGETIARHYTDALGVDTAAIRFVLMVGPGKEARVGEPAPQTARAHASPTTELWGGLAGELIDKPVRGEAGRVPYGDDVADWLWVGDGARALTLAARAPRLKTRVFNISGDVRPVRDAVAYVRTALPGADVTALPGRHDLQAEIDTAPIRDELGFRIEWTMERQIDALIAYARSRTS